VVSGQQMCVVCGPKYVYNFHHGTKSRFPFLKINFICCFQGPQNELAARKSDPGGDERAGRDGNPETGQVFN
jgi:hypothetical protein